MRHHGITAEVYARWVVAEIMRCKGFDPDNRAQLGWKDAHADAHRIVAEGGAYYTAAWEAGDDPKVTAQFLWQCDICVSPGIDSQKESP